MAGVGATMAAIILVSSATASVGARRYTVEMLERSELPIISHANAVAKGHSPYFDTFNPSYIPPSAGFPGGLLLRLANGTGKGSFPESIGFAQCNLTGSPHLICPHQSSLHSGFNLSQKDARAPQQIHTRFHSSADAC